MGVIWNKFKNYKNKSCSLKKKRKKKMDRRRDLLEQVEREKQMAERVKQEAIKAEELKKEKRKELKRKRYLDKINNQSKIAELDVFKPSLNIDSMRIEDKVAKFFQSTNAEEHDENMTEFTQ